MIGDQAAADFEVTSQAAVEDLVDSVVGKAMTELPCLRIAGTADERAALSAKLRVLIVKLAKVTLVGGAHWSWDTDGVFVVTIHNPRTEFKIGVSLLLGETVIKG